MSKREIKRIRVLEQVWQRAITLAAGAGLMGVCYRQAKRLLAKYREGGPEALTHKNRGQAAGNAYSLKTKDQVLRVHQERYSLFNDSHFTEMLDEREGLRIGRETLRKWLRQAGIKPKRRRRLQQGLLVQWDGSPHRWFGPNRPACSLLHAVDDATGTVLVNPNLHENSLIINKLSTKVYTPG